jgi:hypothetical protein
MPKLRHGFTDHAAPPGERNSRSSAQHVGFAAIRIGGSRWQTLADEDDRQRRKNTLPGAGPPQERRSAAWFDAQNCSLEASIGSLIYERNTVQSSSCCELSNKRALQAGSPKNGEPAAAQAGGRGDALGSRGLGATRLRAAADPSWHVSVPAAAGGWSAARAAARAGRRTTPVRLPRLQVAGLLESWFVGQANQSRDNRARETPFSIACC